MKFLVIVLLLPAWTAVSLVRGHAIPQNCSARYQSALQEALDIKNECGAVPAYDCCQVSNTVGLLNTVENLYNTKTGVYTIGQVCSDNEYPFIVHDVHGEMKARCDMETEDGGWLVIQRRVSGGTEDFNRGWDDYENGFGDLSGEFWYGLKNIHCLTTRDDMELRIEFKPSSGTKVTWTYQTFQVAGISTNYRLSIGDGVGSSSFDFMAYSNNRPFTTRDKDNDGHGANCATISSGGWWFHSCAYTVPNAPHGGIRAYSGSSNIYYEDVEMKIRPKSCILQAKKQCQ